MATNFNVSPYFDDFSESKNFHRVLFRPAFAVQARELTQLQTILQNQIERFGEHMFKDGSMVIPGEVTLNTKYEYVKLASHSTSTVANMQGLTVTGSTSGITATVSPTDDSVTIAITLGSIDNSGTDTNRFLVSDGGTIKYRTGSQLRSDIDALNSVSFNNRKYTGDGSTTGFTVTSGQSTDSVIVTENGVVQQPTDDYAISSTTLTFTSAPASGVVINIRELISS